MKIKFGQLQVEAAKSLCLNPYWLVSVTGLTGAEGKILNATLKFCIVCVIVLGIITYFGGAAFNLQ